MRSSPSFQQRYTSCWKLGEDRIRFYHRQDEGFASRKPLDPRDLGPGDTIQ